MIFDSHVHTAASPDCDSPPEEVIAAAAKKNLGIIFTEHVDYNTQLEPFFSVDFDIYPKEYLRYKSDTVLLGFELSLIPEAHKLNQAHASEPGIDYVIGSIHWTDGHDLAQSQDYYNKLGYGVYARHLEYAREMVELNEFFDVLGHIDYISRWSPLPEKNLFYEEHSTAYDELMKALIKRDKLLELSSARLADKTARDNLFIIYSRYHELGGRYVTLGSDSHGPERLGINFNIAKEMIAEIGLRAVYFKDRRMVEC